MQMENNHALFWSLVNGSSNFFLMHNRVFDWRCFNTSQKHESVDPLKCGSAFRCDRHNDISFLNTFFSQINVSRTVLIYLNQAKQLSSKKLFQTFAKRSSNTAFAYFCGMSDCLDQPKKERIFWRASSISSPLWRSWFSLTTAQLCLKAWAEITFLPVW